MTDEERQHRTDEHSSKSAAQLGREILKLLCVLLWKMFLWLLRKFLKGVLWCIQTCEKGWENLHIWWHDNDTQEKVANIKRWLKHTWKTVCKWSIIAGKATLKGTRIGAIALWHGIITSLQWTYRSIIIATKATIQGIIHLRPTLKKIGHLIVTGIIATGAWLKRCGRGIKLSCIRQKRAYQRFRRNGGVKGAMMKTSQNIKNGIQMFMEEDQNEATPDAITEDDIMEEVMEEKVNEGSKSVKFGKSFLSKAKDFMDVE